MGLLHRNDLHRFTVSLPSPPGLQKSPCQPYLGHLRHLAESQPVRLLAYAYVLGMALTAGGKVIRKRIKEALGESASTRAFEFENIDGGDAGVAKRLR